MEDLGSWAFPQEWELMNIPWRAPLSDECGSREKVLIHILCVWIVGRGPSSQPWSCDELLLTRSRRTSYWEAGEAAVCSEEMEKRTCLMSPLPLAVLCPCFLGKNGLSFSAIVGEVLLGRLGTAQVSSSHVASGLQPVPGHHFVELPLHLLRWDQLRPLQAPMAGLSTPSNTSCHQGIK